ncbi:MAG: TIGR04283 family arsenosugar biosynthesis glycosyltransferase [Gammaproteobacteria bacterium]|nr:TIGR04283 family arsenosugar biosynthesis glycosyltransferase [Gammaproteobacteria bacterium]
MFVSIIIPALNEESSIKNLLQQLQVSRQQGHEVIVVDGGSEDQTIAVSTLLADKVIQSDPGRAVQMNKGAVQASGDILWFLHADSVISENAIKNIQFNLNEQNKDWGRFNIKLSGLHYMFRIIEKMINFRSCLSSIATGDQGIFIKRKIFDDVGGYSNIPLMEDIDISKKLRAQSRSVCIKETLTTSSRRWEKNGILSTILLMWRLRFLYWLGISADKLASQYK